MRKKFFIFVYAILILSLLNGCGKKDETDYFLEGYDATEIGKYEDALKYFETAAKKGDEQAQKAADIVSGYLNAKEAMELGNIDSAKDFLSKIPADYKYYPIAADINALRLSVYGADNVPKSNAETSEASGSDSNFDAASALQEISDLINKGYPDIAKKKLEDLDYDTLTSDQKSKADQYRKKLEEKQEENLEESSEAKTSEQEDFTSDKAISYLQQKYQVEGDIGDALTPSYDSDGRKYYEISIQTGTGSSMKILTLHIYGDGTIQEINK